MKNILINQFFTDPQIYSTSFQHQDNFMLQALTNLSTNLNKMWDTHMDHLQRHNFHMITDYIFIYFKIN